MVHVPVPAQLTNVSARNMPNLWNAAMLEADILISND
jgi:hypothetical protein